MNIYHKLSSLVLLALLTACQVQIQPTEIVEDYYLGLNQSSYSRVRAVINKDFKVIEGTNTAVYNTDNYYQWFQWDSVFEPNYNIMDIRTINDSLFVTLSKSCKRINFLHDTPLIYTVHPSIKSDKIVSIELVSYQNADWNTWNTRRDTLIAATARDYPAMKPFIYDQSKQGAEAYLKAIDMWLKGDKF